MENIFTKLFKKKENASYSLADKNNKKALKLDGVTEETLKEVSDNKGED